MVLTAGLLAGAASGIHQIIRAFGEFTGQTRGKARGWAASPQAEIKTASRRKIVRSGDKAP